MALLLTVPFGIDSNICRFLKLEEVLRIRSTSKRLYAKLGTDRYDIWSKCIIDIDSNVVEDYLISELRIAKMFKVMFRMSFDGIERRRRLICGLCDYGHFDTLKWFVDEFKATDEDLMPIENYAFCLSCAGGHLEMAQWLAEKTGITSQKVKKDNNWVFHNTCFAGHLHVAKWLVEQFKLTTADIKDCNNAALTLTCRYGRVNVINWLFEMCEFNIVDLINSYYNGDNALTSACVRNKLNAAKMIVDKIGITDIKRDEAMLYDLYGEIPQICYEGHFQMLKWIVKTFDVKFHDIKIWMDKLLQFTYEYGQFHIVQWIVKRFRIKIEEYRLDYKRMFHNACGNGRLHVAQLAAKRGKIQHCDISTFVDACRNGHVDVAAWLIKKFKSLKSDRSIEFHPPLLDRLCENGELRMIKWITKTFNLSKENFDVIDYRDRYVGIEQEKTIAWLQEFGVRVWW